jgi:hypothetical protein
MLNGFIIAAQNRDIISSILNSCEVHHLTKEDTAATGRYYVKHHYPCPTN